MKSRGQKKKREIFQRFRSGRCLPVQLQNSPWIWARSGWTLGASCWVWRLGRWSRRVPKCCLSVTQDTRTCAHTEKKANTQVRGGRKGRGDGGKDTEKREGWKQEATREEGNMQAQFPMGPEAQLFHTEFQNSMNSISSCLWRPQGPKAHSGGSWSVPTDTNRTALCLLERSLFVYVYVSKQNSTQKNGMDEMEIIPLLLLC